MAGARAPPRHATSLPACLPSPPRSMPRTTPRLPPALSHSPSVPSSSPSLSLSHGRTPPLAAVRHSSRLRPPLAPPTSSGAPPRLPLPPHRFTGLRKPCIAATSPFPPRPPEIIADDSLHSSRPRARFDAHCNRGELRHRFPLFSPSFPHRNPVPTTAEPPPSPSSPSTQLR